VLNDSTEETIDVTEGAADVNHAVMQSDVTYSRSLRRNIESDEPDAGFDHAVFDLYRGDLKGDVENGDSDWPSDHLYRIATRSEAADARCYLARAQFNSMFFDINQRNWHYAIHTEQFDQTLSASHRLSHGASGVEHLSSVLGAQGRARGRSAPDVGVAARAGTGAAIRAG
jgi:hypothetical protein